MVEFILSYMYSYGIEIRVSTASGICVTNTQQCKVCHFQCGCFMRLYYTQIYFPYWASHYIALELLLANEAGHDDLSQNRWSEIHEQVTVLIYR